MSKIVLDGYIGVLYYATGKIELGKLKCPACGSELGVEEFRMEPNGEWISPFLDGDWIEVLREPKKVITFKCFNCLTQVSIPFDEIEKEK